MTADTWSEIGMAKLWFSKVSQLRRGKHRALKVTVDNWRPPGSSHGRAVRVVAAPEDDLHRLRRWWQSDPEGDCL